MYLILRPETTAAAAANAWDKIAGGGVADLRRLPASVVHEAPQCTVLRYHQAADRRMDRAPVLLVPPLAGSSRCYDLRRGHSLAEFLLVRGHPAHLLEYGPIAFADRGLGLEHWVDEVLPAAIRAAAEDVGEPVHVISWSLGGILALLAAAAHPELPLGSVIAVGSPFDVDELPMVVPARALAEVTGGTIALTLLYRALGVAPQPIVRRAFQLQALDKQVTKPLMQLLHLHDREYLAGVEAVDRFISEIEGYPGRTVGQLVHLLFRGNHLADGRLELGGRTIDLADVTVPVLAIAGDKDFLAPRPAVHHVRDLLTGAPQVRLITAPGGHLGVLAGRRAQETTWSAMDAFLAIAGEERPAQR